MCASAWAKDLSLLDARPAAAQHRRWMPPAASLIAVLSAPPRAAPSLVLSRPGRTPIGIGPETSDGRAGLRGAGRLRGRGGKPGANARDADQQVEEVVLGVDRDEAENRLPTADDEAPDGDGDVDHAEAIGVLAGGGGGGPA